MSAEQTIYDVVADVVGDGTDDDFEALTTLLFDKIGMPDEWRRWMAPIIYGLIRTRHRQAVRRRARQDEDDAEIAVLHPRPATTPVGATSIARPQFLRDTIETFGEWGRVAFGEMTAEMHESRIAGQLKLALGVKRDIDKHTDAINRIKAAGVVCLNDLPEYGGTTKAAS